MDEKVSVLTFQLQEKEIEVQELKDQIKAQANVLLELGKQKEELLLKNKIIQQTEETIKGLRKKLKEKDETIMNKDMLINKKESNIIEIDKKLELTLKDAKLEKENFKIRECKYKQEIEHLSNTIQDIRSDHNSKLQELKLKEKEIWDREMEINKKSDEFSIEVERLKLTREFSNKGEVDDNKELEYRLKELDLIKQQKEIERTKINLANKVQEVNTLLKTALSHLLQH